MRHFIQKSLKNRIFLAVAVVLLCAGCNFTSRPVVKPPVSKNQTQSAPQIVSLSPLFGSAGSSVAIKGLNFAPSGNMVFIKSDTGNHPSWNVGTTAGPYNSADGNTLTFVVPWGSDGDPGVLIVPDAYNVYVKNNNGASNKLIFTVTSAGTTN